ncbi:MAG: XRE family transcriptional regulator [Lutibacter sp.]|jgi:transcriptional regulator with XRE-family HTH domain
MNDLTRDLKQSFHDKEYRHGYVDDFLDMSIATQIKVLREQRSWTQADLAKAAGMLQPRISAMENVNYSSWSIKILRRIAESLDLTLKVSFESFGDRIRDIDYFSRKNLEKCSFKDDPYFKEQVKDDLLIKAQRFLDVPEQRKLPNLIYLVHDRDRNEKQTVKESFPGSMYNNNNNRQPRVEDLRKANL